MANNKVQLSNGTVVIDLSSDTVTSASHIKSGLVGHLADGTTATGTLVEKDVKSVTYNLTSGVTANIATAEVVTDQGFSVKLKAPVGYSLSGVTVTMGGVDITEQVFEYDEAGSGGGGTPAISVVDTTDSHGGTVRTITALDISDTTAVAVDVAQGKYFYTAQGVKTAGTGSGGSPSATQHNIHLEFADETDTTISVYYDNALIGTMITAYAPSPWTFNNKLVYYASLDNVLWYDGSGSWETVYDSVTFMTEDTGSGAYYSWVSALGDVPITENSVWKVTWKGVERIHTAVYATFGDGQRYGIDSRNDGTNGTYYIYDTGYGAWMFVGNSSDAGNISIKIEQKTS